MLNLKSCLVAIGISTFGWSALAADITGAGATFPYPIYAKWAEAYKKETGFGLNYQSIGSSGGIRQIRAKTVTFGATDAPLKGEELDKDGLVQFPAIIGGTVPVLNSSPASCASVALCLLKCSWARSASGTTRNSQPSTPVKTCPIKPSPLCTVRMVLVPHSIGPITCPL